PPPSPAGAADPPPSPAAGARATATKPATRPASRWAWPSSTIPRRRAARPGTPARPGLPAGDRSCAQWPPGPDAWLGAGQAPSSAACPRASAGRGGARRRRGAGHWARRALPDKTLAVIREALPRAGDVGRLAQQLGQGGAGERLLDRPADVHGRSEADAGLGLALGALGLVLDGGQTQQVAAEIIDGGAHRIGVGATNDQVLIGRSAVRQGQRHALALVGTVSGVEI